MFVGDHEQLTARSVLCVHPDNELRTAVAEALSHFQPVMVRNALDAIRTLNAKPFDAYVLDYWLPDWHGPALCRQIREGDPHVPICFYSKASGGTVEARAMRAGASACLSAPDDLGVLACTLETLLHEVDFGCMRAKPRLEETLQKGLSERAAFVGQEPDWGRDVAAEALERALKADARNAFFRAGGTAAMFARWWPELFSSALSSYRATVVS